MRTHLSRLVFVLSCFLALAAQAQPPWSRLVVFGDSLSDPGNAFVLTGQVATPPYAPIPDAPYAVGGLHFSNGPTWIEQLAQALGDASAGPALGAPGAFSNYAVAAARARDSQWMDLGEQVALFLDHSGGVAPADALYVIMVGGNDVRDALAALAVDPSGAASLALLAVGRRGPLRALQRRPFPDLGRPRPGLAHHPPSPGSVRHPPGGDPRPRRLRFQQRGGRLHQPRRGDGGDMRGPRRIPVLGRDPSHPGRPCGGGAGSGLPPGVAMNPSMNRRAGHRLHTGLGPCQATPFVAAPIGPWLAGRMEKSLKTKALRLG